MKYVIAEKNLAYAHGFSARTHRTNGYNVILNEKEVMNSSALQGTIEERLKEINGSLYARSELIQIINEGGWND